MKNENKIEVFHKLQICTPNTHYVKDTVRYSITAGVAFEIIQRRKHSRSTFLHNLKQIAKRYQLCTMVMVALKTGRASNQLCVFSVAKHFQGMYIR